ncbi:MAG TPA: hypothetical protein PKM25_16165 [Candidatus Ozemobacteraceae bacterium]|nr:hypothetical protein [Candidatus Ozemobacteraceae bacterium]
MNRIQSGSTYSAPRPSAQREPQQASASRTSAAGQSRPAQKTAQTARQNNNGLPPKLGQKIDIRA